MDTQTQTDIKRIAQMIVDRVHPEQIYLYGSYATGEQRYGSDIDILVLKQGVPSLIDREIDRSANGMTEHLVDVKFLDPSHLDWYPAFRRVRERGILLYPLAG